MKRIAAKVKKKIFSWLRITRMPVIKLYEGFGDEHGIKIYGHVFRLSPLPRKKFSANLLTNMLALLRLFIILPSANAIVRIEWNGESHETSTEHDGFFQYDWKPEQQPIPGWHTAKAIYLSSGNRTEIATAEAMIFIPHRYQYAFISDIDDTFLISHSTSLRKRLFVLLTKNAQSRKPFDDVVNHYKLLSRAGATEEIPNPFFYVSSSEWNLYDYIKEFCRKNEMPAGIFLLNQVRRLKDFWKTGQGKHSGKYVRIARIINSFPNQKYILLGDDSQQDPEIYAAVIKSFPEKIFAVYLRRIAPQREEAAKILIHEMELAGVFCCHFTHSAEAIEHSRKIGLIG
ncbi:MAG: phosphatase domain-containing protein [Chitinophagales bacterium]